MGIFYIFGPLLMSAAVAAEPLPDLSPTAISAIDNYRDCVVNKALELEPAGETAAETVSISLPACTEKRTIAAMAILDNYRLSNGSFDEGRHAVIKLVNGQVNGETVEIAKLAVVSQRARRAK